jgi:dolichol-phosphate mannosyltransferase
MSAENSTRTLVTLATYNEIDNLPNLVADIFAEAPDVDVLVIDDNSPDGTGRWCDQQAVSNPRLHCLHRSGKLGLGTATIAGMQYAIERGYRYVLNMDADFSHHPRHLPAILAAASDDATVIVGSRYTKGGAIEGWPLKRHLMSRAVNFYARCMLRLPTKDCSGSYRCYPTALLKKLDFSAIRSRGYSFQEEVLWHLRRVGAKFREVPIRFADRERGQSKINSAEARAALGIILRLGFRGLVSWPPRPASYVATKPKNR